MFDRLTKILTRRSADEPGVYLAAFGKHPGWNDHIDDQGIENDWLVEAKRILYVQGIGGNIDAGRWDDLPAEDRIEGFGHVFLWRTREGVVVGRLWSSTDGRGRSKYPLVVCCGFVGIDPAWVVERTLGRLEALQAACEATTEASVVVSALNEARRELRDLARDEPAPGPTPVDGERGLRELASSPALADDRVGLHRILYWVESELTAYRRGADDEGARPQQLRASQDRNNTMQTLLSWYRFIAGEVSETTPFWVISPLGNGFVDVLVGEPTPQLWYCLRGGTGAIPLTTQIPYSLDDSFVERVETRLGSAGLPPNG